MNIKKGHMKTQIGNKKKTYIVPLIEQIKLDNEISLVLESDPPFGPGEQTTQAHEYINNDPFKTNIS